MSVFSDTEIVEEVKSILQSDSGTKKYNIEILSDPKIPEDCPYVSVDPSNKDYELVRIAGTNNNYNTLFHITLHCYDSSIDSKWSAFKLVRPMIANIITVLKGNKKLNNKAQTSRVVNVAYDSDVYNENFYTVGRILFEIQNIE